jgi:hypothetical protein
MLSHLSASPSRLPVGNSKFHELEYPLEIGGACKSKLNPRPSMGPGCTAELSFEVHGTLELNVPLFMRPKTPTMMR